MNAPSLVSSSSNVRPTNAAQRRTARRLATYSFCITRATLWRNRSFNGHEAPEIRSLCRANMRESALRAAFWRNLMIADAGVAD